MKYNDLFKKKKKNIMKNGRDFTSETSSDKNQIINKNQNVKPYHHIIYKISFRRLFYAIMKLIKNATARNNQKL